MLSDYILCNSIHHDLVSQVRTNSNVRLLIMTYDAYKREL